MKSKISILALMLSLLLTGCNKEDTSTKGEDTINKSNDIVLYYYHNDHSGKDGISVKYIDTNGDVFESKFNSEDINKDYSRVSAWNLTLKDIMGNTTGEYKKVDHVDNIIVGEVRNDSPTIIVYNNEQSRESSVEGDTTDAIFTEINSTPIAIITYNEDFKSGFIINDPSTLNIVHNFNINNVDWNILVNKVKGGSN